MKRSIGLWQLCGFIFTAIGGTLLHFLYEWSGEAAWAAAISGVNESTWEHMKLLFMPMLIFAALQSPFFRDREDFRAVKLRGILLGILLIPVLFYVYNGAIGKSPDLVNIAIFYISAALAYICETRLFKSERLRVKTSAFPLAVLIAIAALFVIFSFFTPEIAIFRDPLSGKYGR